MPKDRPLSTWVALKAGGGFRATGTADRHYPVNDHLTLNLSGKVTAFDDDNLELQLGDDGNALTASGGIAFTTVGGDTGNRFHAEGRFGPLKFSFVDEAVCLDEGEHGALEAVAEGKLDLAGPLDVRVRVTIRVWKVGADATRIRFVAVRKNGKPLGEGELTLRPE